MKNIKEISGDLRSTHDLEEFFEAYIDCACWCEDINELTELELSEMRLDCANFLVKAGGLLNHCDLSQAGHDFWLSRNNHGSGFWELDRPYIKGQKLHDLAQSFGEYNIFRDEPENEVIE